MLILQIAFIVCLFAAVALIAWSSLRTGAAPMPSSGKARRAMVAAVEVERGGTILDLGSGWGILALSFARRYPDHRVVGYELSLFPYLVSLLLKLVSRQDNLSLYRRNFLEADLSGAALLLSYLSPQGMFRLGEKLGKELHGDVHLVSNTFALPFHRPCRVTRLDDLYGTPVYLYHLESENPAQAGHCSTENETSALNGVRHDL